MRIVLTLPPADPSTDDQPEPAGSDDPDSSRPASGGPARTQSIEIETVNETRSGSPVPDRWIEGYLAKAIELAGVQSARLTVVFVEDDDMAQMHEQYTGVAGTTDVLTFDMAEAEATHPDESPDIEGDIVVCIDEARRQAEKRSHGEHEELLLYAVHGLMHLLGEDDHTEADYQRMHAREDALLEQLGVGPLFHDARPENPNP